MRRDYLLVTGLAILFFFPFLGGIHLFDRAETVLAESAREMLVTGKWLYPQIDFQPYLERPPLFLWLQAISMQIFGVNEFAARFPNAVCGLVTLLLVYRIGLRLHDRLFAWLWVLAWLGSFLPHFYFRSGLIDPWFNLLVFGSLYGFIEFRWQFLTQQPARSFYRKYRWLLLGGILLGLAVLFKGPAAYLIVVLVLGLYWARYRFRGKGYLMHLFFFSVSTLAVIVIWLSLEMAWHGTDFADAFFRYQSRHLFSPDAPKGGFYGYHALVLLIGCFPVSVFAIPNLWGDRQSEDELLESDTLAACQRSDLTTWMQLFFWVALGVFFLVKTPALYYSSLGYFPLTYLGTVTVWRAARWGGRPRAVAFLLPLGLVAALAAMALPFLGKNQVLLQSFLAGSTFGLEALKADVSWEWWHFMPGAVLLLTTAAGWYFWQQYRPWMSAQVLFGGGAIFTTLTGMTVVCNLEGHLQRAAVDFYKSKRGEPCEIRPVGFRTYAHLFYSAKPATSNAGKKYLVVRMDSLEHVADHPGCRELYRKNGYVFFEEMPAGKTTKDPDQ